MAFTHNHYNYLQARKAHLTWKWATKAARQFQHLKVFEKKMYLDFNLVLYKIRSQSSQKKSHRLKD